MIKRSNGLTRIFPIFGWLPGYRRAWLWTDFIAGLTVCALLVPEGMAYAQLAGMPPQTAFYAAPIGLLLFAIFGTSRQLVVAVSSTIAVMSAATVAAYHPQGTPEFIAYTAALAMLAGAIAVLAGLLKLGRIAQFFSESVLTGFVFGLALVIAVKQVPKILGIEAGGEDFFERVWEIIIHLPETSLPTLAVGLLCLALMLLIEKRYHRIPAALVALVFGILISSLFGLEGRGVEVVGDIPAGLALPKLPVIPLQEWLLLIPGAMGIALVNFAEAIGPSRSFAREHKYEIDADKELVGLGAANLGAGLFQGFSIGASLSKSSANDRAGANSQMSGIVAAVLTLLVALFLTPLFQNLPEATLGAIVIVAVSGMMKVGEMRRLRVLRRADFLLAMVALFGVLVFDVLPGLIIAVALSLFALIWRASQSKISQVGRDPGKLDFSDANRHTENMGITGLLILRTNEGIFFANSASLKEEILNRVRRTEPPPKAVLLDLEMSFDLDVPAVDMLNELYEELEESRVRLMLCRVHGEARDMLDRSGFTAKIGVGNIHSRVLEGTLAYLSDQQDWREIQKYVHDGLREALWLIHQRQTKAENDPKGRMKSVEKQLVEVIEWIETKDPDSK